mmetsp:Transcript_21774/g.32163  ORF Transcript_21774/g.32163 Transcript_21774/m.32163 type:complete len:142 (-) Transcript_21774:53-478(-)
MLQRLALFLLLSTGLVTFVSSQLTVGNPECTVCGKGYSVGNTATFSIPPPYDTQYGYSEVQCDTLATSGIVGLIPADLCELLPTGTDILEICECEDADGNPAPKATPAPAPAPGAIRATSSSPKLVLTLVGVMVFVACFVF